MERKSEQLSCCCSIFIWDKCFSIESLLFFITAFSKELISLGENVVGFWQTGVLRQDISNYVYTAIQEQIQRFIIQLSDLPFTTQYFQSQPHHSFSSVIYFESKKNQIPTSWKQSIYKSNKIKKQMQLHKLGASLSTIPNDSRHYYQSFNLTKSNVDLHNPFKDQYPLKFPKNKNIRKQTQTHMLVQTMQNPEKSCVRNYPHANRSIVFDEPGRSRRELKNGMFYSLSRESIQPMPLNRSSEDIGVPNNRKKANYYLKNKPNPILIGEKDLKHVHISQKKNSNLQKVWTQPRRHRDNGALCSETMVWKQKPNSSYLQLYKNKQNGPASKRVSKFSILN